jgi:DNA-binding response OmpR family regulator
MDVGLDATGIPLRVLVVEPMGYCAAILKEIGALAGFSVDLVRDPRSAARLLQNDSYDVIVVDLPPPHMTATELFRSILAVDIGQACRVVFLVNDLGDSGTRKFLTDAGRPFLTLPADPTELYELVLRVALQDRED